MGRLSVVPTIHLNALNVVPLRETGPAPVRQATLEEKLRSYRREVEQKTVSKRVGQPYSREVIKLPPPPQGTPAPTPASVLRRRREADRRRWALQARDLVRPSTHPAGSSRPLSSAERGASADGNRPHTVGNSSSGRVSSVGPLPEPETMRALAKWVSAAEQKFGGPGQPPCNRGVTRACAKWLALSCNTSRGKFLCLADLEVACLDLGIPRTEATDVAARLWAGLACTSAGRGVPVTELLKGFQNARTQADAEALSEEAQQIQSEAQSLALGVTPSASTYDLECHGPVLPGAISSSVIDWENCAPAELDAGSSTDERQVTMPLIGDIEDTENADLAMIEEFREGTAHYLNTLYTQVLAREQREIEQNQKVVAMEVASALTNGLIDHVREMEQRAMLVQERSAAVAHVQELMNRVAVRHQEHLQKYTSKYVLELVDKVSMRLQEEVERQCPTLSEIRFPTLQSLSSYTKIMEQKACDPIPMSELVPSFAVKCRNDHEMLWMDVPCDESCWKTFECGGRSLLGGCHGSEDGCCAASAAHFECRQCAFFLCKHCAEIVSKEQEEVEKEQGEAVYELDSENGGMASMKKQATPGAEPIKEASSASLQRRGTFRSHVRAIASMRSGFLRKQQSLPSQAHSEHIPHEASTHSTSSRRASGFFGHLRVSFRWAQRRATSSGSRSSNQEMGPVSQP